MRYVATARYIASIYPGKLDPITKSVGPDPNPNSSRSTIYKLDPVQRGGKPFILEVTDMHENKIDWMDQSRGIKAKNGIKHMSSLVPCEELIANLLQVWAGGMVGIPTGAAPGIMQIEGWSPKLHDKQFLESAKKAKVGMDASSLRDFYLLTGGQLAVDDIEPTAAEKRQLMAMQTAFADYMFNEGERLYLAKEIGGITRVMKEMGAWLGKARLWIDSSLSADMVACKLCAHPVRDGQAVCGGCGARQRKLTAEEEEMLAGTVALKKAEPQHTAA